MSIRGVQKYVACLGLQNGGSRDRSREAAEQYRDEDGRHCVYVCG